MNSPQSFQQSSMPFGAQFATPSMFQSLPQQQNKPFNYKGTTIAFGLLFLSFLVLFILALLDVIPKPSGKKDTFTRARFNPRKPIYPFM